MQAQLRKYHINCVILWSGWPETYSYTYFESYAANTFILTCRDSGNIAYMVDKTGNGLVLRDEAQLQALIGNPMELSSRIDAYYKSKGYGPLKLNKNCEIENLLEKKVYRFPGISKMTRRFYDNQIMCATAKILYWIKYGRML